MTPKEKAKEIVIKMQFQKKYALIAIDEILIVLEKELLTLYSQAKTCNINKNMQNYYLKVKEELKNLPA